MYLLDTNYCSYIIQGRPDVTQRLQDLGSTLIAVSTITRGELMFMAERSQKRAENHVSVRAFLDAITILPVDTGTADIYGNLKAAILRYFGPRERSKQRRSTIGQLGFDDNDLWIAATAIQHGLVLVSADSDFGRIKEIVDLSLEQW